MRLHPDAFEDAKAYEKTAADHGSPFTWADGESLEEMMKPKRIAAIEADYEKRLERLNKKRRLNPLRAGMSESIDEVYGINESESGCLICHK